MLDDLQIPMEMPHHIYKGQFPIYDEIYILLCHMLNLYKRKGVETYRLQKGLSRIFNWLKSEKAAFNRKRSLSQEDLESRFTSLFLNDDISKIIGNSKLTKFLEDIVINRRCFDYLMLKCI